jgi:hypothetical protein
MDREGTGKERERVTRRESGIEGHSLAITWRTWMFEVEAMRPFNCPLIAVSASRGASVENLTDYFSCGLE